jgi:V8-like Glu-specific endopeptidase
MRRGLLTLVAVAIATHAHAQSISRVMTPVADKSSRLLKVYDEDQRELIEDTTTFPYSAIGFLQSVWFEDDSSVVVASGTGVLIGNSVVLTAGHCIYDQDHGWADQILFMPGRDGDVLPFGQSYSVRTISQRAWVEDGDNRYDIAMVVLSEPLGQQAGYMTVGVESTSFFTNRNLNTAGYPADLSPGTKLYHSFGPAIDVLDGLIRHTMDSERGQSGSPIWYFDSADQSRRVLGVLTGSREFTSNGAVVESYNVGIHINEAFGEWINETLATYDTVDQTVDINTSDDGSDATAPVCGTGVSAAASASLVLMAMFRFVGRRPA